MWRPPTDSTTAKSLSRGLKASGNDATGLFQVLMDISDVEVIIWQRITRPKELLLENSGKAWFNLINLFIDPFLKR